MWSAAKSEAVNHALYKSNGRSGRVVAVAEAETGLAVSSNNTACGDDGTDVAMRSRLALASESKLNQRRRHVKTVSATWRAADRSSHVSLRPCQTTHPADPADALDSWPSRRIMESDDERVGNETNSWSVISSWPDIKRKNTNACVHHTLFSEIRNVTVFNECRNVAVVLCESNICKYLQYRTKYVSCEHSALKYAFLCRLEKKLSYR